MKGNWIYPNSKSEMLVSEAALEPHTDFLVLKGSLMQTAVL